MALVVPLSRFTSRVGGGSAFFVRRRMRFVIHQFILASALFAACQVAAQDFSVWREPILFTNQTAIANGKAVLSAVYADAAQSKTNIQALIGSQVVFYTHRGPTGTNCVLTLRSNFVVFVEFNPPYKYPGMNIFWGHGNTYPCDEFYSTEILGTLKSIDMEKRIVTVVARQEDWKVREMW